MKFLTSSTFILLILALPSFAHTCVSIMGYTDEEFRNFLDRERAIFLGEVIATEPPANNTQRIKVRLRHTWKYIDDHGGDVSILYVGAYSSFEKEIGGVGTQRIFYAGIADDGGLRVSYCGFQGEKVDERMKAFLGDGRVVEQATKDTKPMEISFWARLWSNIASLFGA